MLDHVSRLVGLEGFEVRSVSEDWLEAHHQPP